MKRAATAGMKAVCCLILIFSIGLIGCAGAPASTQGSTSGMASATDTQPPTQLGTTQMPTQTPSPAQELLAQMSLEEKVSQLFIVEVEALLNENWGIDTYSGQKFLYPVGGVILFAGNIKNPRQCTDFLAGLQGASSIPLFTAVDEEGGYVARIGNNPNMGTTAFPPMKEILTEDNAYNVGSTIGREIRQLGFNLDLAPVADVTSNPEVNVMKGRSFGSDPQQVAKLVSAAVRGFRDSGMLCTLKHFPGHGNTGTDSHDGYTVLNRTLEQLRQVEFPPFKAGIAAGANFVMLGHLSMPQLTGNSLPATLSPELVRLLREEVGYEGLIMTDSLQMGAIVQKYSSGEAAVMALEAGADVILMPEKLPDAVQGVLAAVQSGRLTEQRIHDSVRKILELKYESGIIS